MSDAAIKAKKLDEALFDNLREVFNVCASLFNVSGGRHVVFRDATQSLTASQEALRAIPTKATVNLEARVSGYKTGSVVFLVT